MPRPPPIKIAGASDGARSAAPAVVPRLGRRGRPARPRSTPLDRRRGRGRAPRSPRQKVGGSRRSAVPTRGPSDSLRDRAGGRRAATRNDGRTAGRAVRADDFPTLRRRATRVKQPRPPLTPRSVAQVEAVFLRPHLAPVAVLLNPWHAPIVYVDCSFPKFDKGTPLRGAQPSRAPRRAECAARDAARDRPPAVLLAIARPAVGVSRGDPSGCLRQALGLAPGSASRPERAAAVRAPKCTAASRRKCGATSAASCVAAVAAQSVHRSTNGKRSNGALRAAVL